MIHFFASLYKWWGFNPFYSADLDEFLKGLDFGCTGYLALQWYVIIGLFMVIATTLLFGLQYDLIDSRRFKKQKHWILAAFVVVVVNFAPAFAVPFVAIETGNYCLHLKITAIDCIGFGISNSLWSLILFSVLSLAQTSMSALKR